MKWITIAVLFVFGMIFSVGGLLWSHWIYPRTYEYPLQLADDASLPEQKAAYLQEYLNKVSEINGPPRYIFTRPDLNLDTQKKILQGLITRFSEIAKLEPKDMAYQQGMFQLTGQEVDHQLKRISGIFFDASIRENPILYFMFFWLWLLAPISMLIAVVFSFME